MTRLLAGLALVLAVSSADAQRSKKPHSFKVSDGLEFKLWASEPLFVNPTCMDVDHKGRVWVCESVNYRNKLRRFKKLTRAAGDRIVILEDGKGEGKATKATTFYQSPELMAPLGIAVAPYPDGKGCKVYVCQSPDLLVFEDKDGDGKADGPPRKLLTGFGGIDHDHGVHSVLIGPDRKLYFTVGDSGVHGLQSSDKKGRVWKSNSTDCRAGTVWRCELDGTKLELMAHNFRNNYEVAVDSFGTMFLSDNDDDGNMQTRICHVIPGGNYGYHPRGKGESHWHEEQPGVMPKILRTGFGSPTGMCIYEGKLLPKKYHGMPLHTDAGPRHVRAYHLKPKGASYEVDREDMVEGSDPSFRPSDVCAGPDGSVYVADWHDPVVGGHDMKDIETGRVYRLAPKGAGPAKNPAVDLKTDKGVLAALGSPNLATRAMAMEHIAGMERRAAIRLLEPATSQTEDPVLRARAAWQLGRRGENAGIWKDGDANSRIQMLRIAYDWADGDVVPVVVPFVEEALGIRPPLPTPVFREALVLLRNADPAKSKDLIYALMKHYDGKDRFYLACVGIAVGTDPKRREAILADFAKHFPEWDDKVASLVFELRPPGVVPLLKKRLLDKELAPKDRYEAMRSLLSSDDKEAGPALLDVVASDGVPEARDQVVNNLAIQLGGKWKAMAKGKPLADAIVKMLDRPATRRHAMELVAGARRADFAGKAEAIARDGKEAPQVRLEALSALGQIGGKASVAALADLAMKLHPPLSHAAALGLGGIARSEEGSSKEAVAALEGMLEAVGGLDKAAGLALAGTLPGGQRLLALHAEKKLPARVIESVAGPLRNSAYPDIQKRARIAFPAPGKMDPRKLPPVADLALRKGDAARGKRIWEASARNDAACAKCHTVRGQGGQVGPDLSMIGKKAPKLALLESILYPSKAIADQYLMWTVTTKRGVQVQGLLIEDSPAAIVIRDAEGRDTRIGAANVEKKEKSLKSIMPEELVAHLTPDELVDLVEYLGTLKIASFTVPAWRIIGPFDNGEGMEGLDKVFPPEKGIDLKADYDGKHGKVKWASVRPGTTGYVDLQAHHGDRGANSVSYLVADVESPADQSAEIVLGSDDGCKVWLDGKLVHTSKETRAATPEQARVKATLKKGVNRVLFKINNGNNPHGLYFRIESEQELKAVAVK
ncbi:MAG: c-type cytochrome [Gemmataceae bacterium]|nr:c-type cytochrome [Gemmataceae bacterium]